MFRPCSRALIRIVCLLILLITLALSGLSAAAASIRYPVPPIVYCIPGKCPNEPPPCGEACLKNPPPAPLSGGNSAAGVTNFHAGLDMEWADAALDGPCTDPSHLNCVPNVPVFHLSFESARASAPVVILGIGDPGDGGYFPPAAPTTTLPVEVGATTSHAWTLYPAQQEFQLFSNWTDHWPQETRDLWNQGWAVVMAYDPGNRGAPPQDFPLS
jgi:hypothetical protein